MLSDLKHWYRTGEPFVWLNAGAVSISVIMVAGLMALIAYNGLSHFWPHAVYEYDYTENGQETRLIGEISSTETVSAIRIRESGIQLETDEAFVERDLIKIGNRDVYGVDFKNIVVPLIVDRRRPEKVMTVERLEYGNFYGFLTEVRENGQVVATGPEAWDALQERIDRANELHGRIKSIEKYDIGDINYAIEKLRLKQRGYELDDALTEERRAELDRQRAELNTEYKELMGELQKLYTQIKRDSFLATIQTGQSVEIPLSQVVRAFQPNDMGLFSKIIHYIAKLWEFMSADPREANTEGGIFPAIFGTVTMVMLMALLVTPFGVIAALYLREYANQGPVVRMIRIAVNNLAGVPSIVYGVFGLGFFVYFMGQSIDQAMFPEALPAPTFGTSGLLWASLTLALLTLPVVIVSTEEGLARIPSAVREGSLALGSTKSETLMRIVVPMASPAIMTGMILAIARAAGEVAPLMLVGVVKLAPSLPVDGNAPFLHLDRKIMHLGFHIYDVGFQSPNVEAARPLVYATALLLVAVIVVLNLAAIYIRNHLREKYRALEQ